MKKKISTPFITKSKNQRLILILILLALLGTAVFLVLRALSDGISYFYAPSEVLTSVANRDGRIKVEQKFRIGGLVKKHSVQRKSNQLIFTITDFAGDVDVRYQGLMPDLFREESGVIAYGFYDAKKNLFTAIEILAKHDENYMPREVADALKKTGVWEGGGNKDKLKYKYK